MILRTCTVPTEAERVSVYKLRASLHPEYSAILEAARARKGLAIQRRLRRRKRPASS